MARAILQRASELQGTLDPAPAGLTLGEVQAAGAAAGLSPEVVLRAAREVSGHARSSTRDGQMRVETRTVAAPMTARAWEEIQAELGWRTGGQGEVRDSVHEALYKWVWRLGGYELARLRVEHSAEETHLTLQWIASPSRRNLAMLTGTAGLLPASFFLAFMMADSVGQNRVLNLTFFEMAAAFVAMSVLFAALGVAASRSLYRRLYARDASKRSVLADRLADLVATHAPEGPGSHEATPARPALTLSDADDASPEASASLRRNGPVHG